VPWEVDGAGARPRFQGGVAWPGDARLGGRFLVAALCWPRPGRGEQTPPRLWWLRLDADGGAIEAAGPLEPDPDQGTEAAGVAQTHPAVATTPAGELVLAYLEHHRDDPRWSVRLRSLALADETGALRAGAMLRAVDDGPCLPIAPAFSPDGRTLVWVAGNDATGPRVRRMPVPSRGTRERLKG
jgi:hypothetical protein